MIPPQTPKAEGAPQKSDQTVEASEAAVRFVAVSKSFDGEKLVIDNLNLDIRRGEFLTMLGPSGSGKTTSLMMLAGFETVTDGDILLNGKSLKHVPPYRRNIGMVFQNYALFPHLSVAENLAFPLEARKLSKVAIARKVDRALDMVRLTGLSDRKPAQLSGGQQQRVAVARALIYEPELVLMDEPLGALDKQLREQMQLELKHIHERLGLTFVYVTHDQAEALTISDRIAVFNEGRIQQIDAPTRLYEAPATVFVAEFLGENNRMPGIVRNVVEGVCKVELENGQCVIACPAAALSPGSRTTLCLRPESVRLSPRDVSCENHAEAEIMERIYLGDHLRLRVRLCGRDDFIIKVPRNADVPALQAGNVCAVGWDSRDCRALEAVAPENANI